MQTAASAVSQLHAAIEPEEPHMAIQPKSYAAPATGINFTVQKKENKTGLPDRLKSGIENLSGHSMDDVKVHYNSSQPAQLNAHAYAQGNQIHMASGQEKHLAHEAWHVVQQKQGRVKPTKQLKSSVAINDDAGLEKEADVMGGKAMGLANSPSLVSGYSIQKKSFSAVLQRVKGLKKDDKVKVNVSGQIKKGTIESISGYGEEAYNVTFDDEDNVQMIDQTYVFSEDTSDEKTISLVKPLDDAISINSNFGEKGIKKFDETTLNGEKFAPRKLNEIRSDLEKSENAGTVIKAAVIRAAGLLSLHPFHDGNGRTALYYIYSDALQSGFEITLTPLEMHGLTLGEEQQQPIAGKQEAVIESIVSKCKKTGDEFDAKTYLSAKLAGLVSLEADRDSQGKEREEQNQKDAEERRLREKEDEENEKLVEIKDLDSALKEAVQPVKRLVEHLQLKNIMFKKQEFGRNWMAFHFKRLEEMPAKTVLQMAGLEKAEDLKSIIEWLNKTFDCEMAPDHFEEKEAENSSDDDSKEQEN